MYRKEWPTGSKPKSFCAPSLLEKIDYYFIISHIWTLELKFYGNMKQNCSKWKWMFKHWFQEMRLFLLAVTPHISTHKASLWLLILAFIVKMKTRSLVCAFELQIVKQLEIVPVCFSVRLMLDRQWTTREAPALSQINLSLRCLKCMYAAV